MGREVYVGGRATFMEGSSPSWVKLSQAVAPWAGPDPAAWGERRRWRPTETTMSTAAATKMSSWPGTSANPNHDGIPELREIER